MAANIAASSTLSVISAGNGQFKPAVASRFNVNRTVDGATPTRRAISLSPTPALLNRSTSRTRRIGILSAGIRSPVQKPKERTLIGPAEASLNRARSSRNGERNHLGTPSDIKSEWWARSSRIRGRLPSDSAAGRYGALDGVEEADEFLVGMALHAAAMHDTVERVEGSE